MTLRFYKRAMGLGGADAAVAGAYVSGALHGMLLLSDSLSQSDGTPVFCPSEAQAEQGDQLMDTLGNGFVDWLGKPGSGGDIPEVQDAPVAMFVAAYLTAQLSCTDATARGNSGGKDGDLGAILKRVLPQP